MSDTVGCLCGFTIPSVRPSGSYTCASCSNNHTTTTSTTNKVNKRNNIVVHPYRELSLLRGNTERQPTTLIFLKAVSIAFGLLGTEDGVLISEGSGLRQKSTHRFGMGAFKHQCVCKFLISSISCMIKLSTATDSVSLSAGLALPDFECLSGILVSYEANRLSVTKESAFTTLRNKYFVTSSLNKLYHAFW